jgi:3-hydroxyisobutyrate dehydrogenase-like beta-hydroxyacid dehydrogenase
MMSSEIVGILHPGEMGIFVAASAKNSGNEVRWVSEGRSEQTRQRADKYGLTDAGSLVNLCQTCSIIISVCPPHAAEDVARQVLAHKYKGLYLDANAISPHRVRSIGERMGAGGIDFVDGGIVGGPVWEGGKTWLYLAGDQAERVAACFTGGPLATHVLTGGIGKASALKMCYAAYTKGTTALLCSILATAEKNGVREELENQWSRDWDGFAEQAERRTRRVTAKAWRFTGEMEEISATFSEAGLPGDFHSGAAEVYRRLAGFKDAESTPELDEVFKALLQEPASVKK